MGYLDNSSITVDAILTKKGRELLAKGRTNFKITQFALADDEVDYDLWNPAHPLGSDYYGVVIESMPVTEAVPDETQSMKYKLVTLPKRSTAIPKVTLDVTSLSIATNVADDRFANLIPKTTYNGTGTISTQNLNSFLGYTATLLDSTYATIRAIDLAPGAPNNTSTSMVSGDNETASSQSAIGLTFRVQPRGLNIVDPKSTKVVITANETGGRVVIPITITQRTDGQR